MAKLEINLGTAPNSRDGDNLRSAFAKVNDNFTELYTALGLAADANLNLGAFEFTGSTITTTDSTAITIDQATTVTSDLTVSGDILPSNNLASTLGSPTKKFHSLYVGTGSVYLGDAKLSLESGKLTSSVGFNLTGSVGEVSGAVEWDNILNKPSVATESFVTSQGYLTQEDLVAEITDGGNTARAGLSYSTSSVSIGAVQDPDGDFNSLSATVTAAGGEVTLRASQENNGDPQTTSVGELSLNTGMFIVGIADGVNPGAEIVFTQNDLTIPVPIVSPIDTAFSITTADSNAGDPIINEFTFGIDGSLTVASLNVVPQTEEDGVDLNGAGITNVASVTMPASGTITGTDDLIISSQVNGNSSGLFLNGNPIVGSAVLYANGVATIRANNDVSSKDWSFDKSGTLTTPLLFPRGFAAVLDTEHFYPQPGIALAGEPWSYQFEFQVNPDGSVQTMANDPVFFGNPGYAIGHAFRFTEAEHGIPGYTFDVTITDIGLEAGGYFTQIAVSPPPTYPSTITTTGAIKLTSNDNSWTLGTDGKLTVPTVSGEGLFIQGAEIGSTNSGIAVTATNNIVLGTDALGTAKFWVLGTNGTLTLPAGGDIVDSNGTSVLGGGTVQPYLEVTNTPFITQPVILGEPVTVTAPVSGQGATVEVVIGEGPIIDNFNIVNAGTGYVVGQQYKIWEGSIGGNVIGSAITFEVVDVGENGELVAVGPTPAFAGVANNTPGTYSGVSIELISSVRDEISTEVVLTRSLNQALYNIAVETEYDNNTYTSPLGTEWNSDGWANLVGIGSRSYTTFRSALGGQVGNNVVGTELVMRDIANDRYYKFEFTDWGQNNGGSYSYTRTEITDSNFFRKTDDGDEVDVFVEDDGQGAGIGITRGGQQGIYNPYRDEGWDGDFTPSGTEWNIDGWDDLSDIEERTYTNFFAAYGNGGLGNKVPGSKAVMYIPDTGTYYAIHWLSWTQNANGGGFSYLRYELDLTKLNEGIRFPDGSVLKSAEGVGRVKSTASLGRRIEEVVGSNTVSVTSVTTTNITATASRTVEGDNRFWVSRIDTNIAAIMDNPSSFGILDYATIQFSLDNITWYTYNGGYSSTAEEIGVSTNGLHTYNQGDTIYFRYDTGGAPQVWWDKNDLPGGSADFRGAVINYHAYSGEATWIGTIHIVDDTGNEHISHTEVNSGSSDAENDDLWLVQNEGTISYRRIDGEAKTLKVHWTAKVFYGDEYYD